MLSSFSGPYCSRSGPVYFTAHHFRLPDFGDVINRLSARLCSDCFIFSEHRSRKAYTGIDVLNSSSSTAAETAAAAAALSFKDYSERCLLIDRNLLEPIRLSLRPFRISLTNRSYCLVLSFSLTCGRLN